jgi:OOP family OmpA-OmpF porin
MNSAAPDAASEEVNVRRRDLTCWVDERDGRFPWPWWKMGLPAVLAGLATAAILTAILVPIYQNDMIRRTEAALRADGIDPDRFAIEASYRDVTISGILPDGVTESRIRDAVAGEIDEHDLDLRLRAPAPAPEPEPVEEDPAEEAAPEPAPVLEEGPTEVTATIADGAVLLEGVVLTEQQRRQLVAQAEFRYGAENVTDLLTVSGLAPATSGASGRVLKLATLIQSLPRAAEGVASLTDDDLAFRGVVPTDADKAAIDEFLATTEGRQTPDPSEVSVDSTIVENEIDDLQAQFDALAVEIRERVVFETGSDVLDPIATETLDKVVALMTQYELPVVEIRGHTDDQGDATANQVLSEARAAAVVAYLAEAGIDEARMRFLGIGEAEPIASNDTPEGRAENRRVELEAFASF